MASVTEYYTTEVSGTWTGNANAWDGDTSTFDYASTTTGDAQTVGGPPGTRTNFGAIPSGATIKGIVVEIYAYGDADDTVSAALSYDGTNYTSTKSVTPGTTAGWKTYGGSMDTWGRTWTDSEIDTANFKCRLTYSNVTKANTMYVGSVRVTVTYAVPISTATKVVYRTLKTVGEHSISSTPSSPALEYKFESGTDLSIDDTSANNYEGTGNNTRMSSVRAVGARANRFDSFDSNIYIDGNVATNLQASGDLTISAWVYVSSTEVNGGVVMSKYESASDVTDYQFCVSNKLKFRRSDSPYTQVYNLTSVETITTNAWYHVAAVVSSKTVKMYINNVECTYSASNTYTLDGAATTNDIYIGGSPELAFYGYIGYMDDLRFYSRALSTSELTELYTRTFSPKLGTLDNIRNLVNTTVTQIYNISEAGVVYAKVEIKIVYGINTVIESVQTSVYNVRGWLPASTVETDYNIRSAIGSDILLNYNIKNAIGKTKKLIYNITTPVGSRVLIDYNLLRAIGATKKAAYNLRAAVGGYTRPVYNIWKVIGSQSLFIYNMRGLTAASVLFVYDILSTVMAETAVTLAWKIAGKVTASVDSLYNVFNIVSSGADLLYGIRKAVGAYTRPIYHLRGYLGPSTVDLLYSLRNALLNACRIKYNMYEYRTSLVDMLYNVRNAVASTNEYIYNVRNVALSTKKLSYNILNIITSNASIRIKYSLGISIIVGELAIAYSLRNCVSAASEIVYSILTEEMFVSATMKSVYNIYNKVKIAPSCVYNIRQVLSSHNECLYSIRNLTLPKDHFCYNAIDVAGYQSNVAKNGDTLYVVIQGVGRDPYAYKFDGNSWTDGVKIADTNLPNDGHGAASMCRDDDGYLHAFFGCHDSAIQYYRSTNPDDITSWTNKTTALATTGTYPFPVNVPGEDKIYLIYRSGAAADYDTAYKISTDNGDTWGAKVRVIDYTTPEIIYLVHYGHWLEVIDGHLCVHFVGVYHNYTLTFRHNFYYFRFDTYDGKIYNIADVEVAQPANYTTMTANCLVLNSSNRRCYNGCFVKQPDGTPMCIINYEYSAGSYKFISLEWNGSSWTNSRDIFTTTQIDFTSCAAFPIGEDEVLCVFNDDSYAAPLTSPKKIYRYVYDCTEKIWTREEDFRTEREIVGDEYAVWFHINRQPTDRYFLYQERNYGTAYPQDIPCIVCLASVDDNGEITVVGSNKPNSKEVVYNLRNVVDSVANIIYNIRNAVGGHAHLLYNLRKAAGGYTRPTYHIRSAIDSSVMARYNIVGAIGSSVKLLYSIRNRFASISNLIYNIRDIVSGSSKYAYNIRMAAGSFVRPIYDIRFFTGASVKLSYNIFNAIVSSTKFLYNVLLETVYATAAIKTIYNLRNSVGSDVSAIYNIRNFVVQFSDIVYNIGGILSTAMKLRYSLLNVITPSSFDVSYNIRGSIYLTVKILYDIINTISSSSSLVWNMKNTVINDFGILYFIAKDLIFSSIETTLGIKYNVYSKHTILMREPLARYYRDRLVEAMRNFDSQTIKMMDVNVTGVTFGPTRPKETLHGATITMQFIFKGADDWEK